MNYGVCLVGVETPGVGRGATGRRFSFKLVFGRVFVFRFMLGRGVTFAFSPAAFAFGLLALAGLLAFAGRFAFAFVLPFAFALPFAFVFFGFLGLFSFAFAAFVLRLSFGSSAGGTVSGDSPALA